MDPLYDLNYQHLLYFWTVAQEKSVTAACTRLGLAQPTISMQIRKLEKQLGCRLFHRVGRGLVLTEVGQAVFHHAEQIFAAGRELTEYLAGRGSAHAQRLVVGIPDAMPKLIAFRILQKALRAAAPATFECLEAKLSQLISEMAEHRFDVVLSDAPLGIAARVKAFQHPLGESPLAICGARSLAIKVRKGFPHSLQDAPMLLPSNGTELRRLLEQWFQAHRIRPRVVGEIEDSALLKEFGHAGFGLFAIPRVVLDDVVRQYNVEHIGTLDDARMRFFAITTARKVHHPVVEALIASAQHDMFA